MSFKGFLSVCLVLVLASCTVTLRKEEISPVSTQKTAMVVPAQNGTNGLVYALPKTGLRFTIKAHKIEKKRGDFYLYSERFLGLKDVILEDVVEWQISEISVEPFGVASTEELFEVVAPLGVPIPLMQLSDDGVLLGINSSTAVVEEEVEKKFSPKQEALVIPYTEEMILANSSAKMAQEAANYIYRLRESRTALLSSDLDVLPPDGGAYAMSLEEMDKIESQFISLFKGEEIISCVTKTIDIVPSEVIDKDVLFRFSSFNGVVASDDLSGSPYFITMEQSDLSNLVNTPADSAALFYKKPAPIQVKVLDGSTEILSEKILIGQFGVLQTLAPHMLNEDVKIEFYPTTGAIKAIKK